MTNPSAETAALALLEGDLVILDCEMSGGDTERHDIIEIGAARARLPELTILAELSLKVAPRGSHGANQESLRIAGYSAKGWKGALAIDIALRELADFSAGALLVGWATYNDLLFLQAAAARVPQGSGDAILSLIEGLLGNAYLEVQDWAQLRLHFGRSPSLQRVADQLKIVRDQDHSAIEDALVTYEVLRMLWRYSPEELDAELPELSWTSYADLAGPINLSREDEEARRAEAARYVVTATGTEALLALRGVYKRD